MAEWLNWIWAVCSLVGIAGLGWSCSRMRHRRPDHRGIGWQRMVGGLVLAGFLFPCISANDDVALWNQAAASTGMRQILHARNGATVQGPGLGAAGTASGTFWLLFNHLSAPLQVALKLAGCGHGIVAGGVPCLRVVRPVWRPSRAPPATCAHA